MKVTIEGSLTPYDLPRGARRVVELTKSVRERIERGYYRLIDGSLDEESAQPIEIVEDEKTPPEQADGVGEDDDTPAVESPHANASTEEWLTFLHEQGVEVPVDEHGHTPGRNALRDLWHARLV